MVGKRGKSFMFQTARFRNELAEAVGSWQGFWVDLGDLGEKVLVVGYTEEEEEAQRAQRMIGGSWKGQLAGVVGRSSWQRQLAGVVGRGSWQLARG
jgi:hypothetical protein